MPVPQLFLCKQNLHNLVLHYLTLCSETCCVVTMHVLRTMKFSMSLHHCGNRWGKGTSVFLYYVLRRFTVQRTPVLQMSSPCAVLSSNRTLPQKKVSLSLVYNSKDLHFSTLVFCFCFWPCKISFPSLSRLPSHQQDKAYSQLGKANP